MSLAIGMDDPEFLLNRGTVGLMRIPSEVGQAFRGMWATHSDRSGPPIPRNVGQGFRGRGPVIPTCGPPLGHERRRRWIT